MKTAIRIAALIVIVTVLVWGRAPSPAPPQARVIANKAHRFEFVPDHITLKKGEPVVLQVTSEDVTHGFFVRPLKIDEDLAPGQTKQIPLTPQTAGTYTLICDHFCGVNHGNMHMTIEVVE